MKGVKQGCRLCPSVTNASGRSCHLRKNSEGACSMLWPAEDLGLPVCLASRVLFLSGTHTLNRCPAHGRYSMIPGGWFELVL